MYKWSRCWICIMCILFKSSLELSRMFEDSFFVHHLLFVAFQSLSTAFRFIHCTDFSPYGLFKVKQTAWVFMKESQKVTRRLVIYLQAQSKGWTKDNSEQIQSVANAGLHLGNSGFQVFSVTTQLRPRGGGFWVYFYCVASQNLDYPIMVHLAANWRLHVGHFWPNENIGLLTYYVCQYSCF